MKRTELVAAAKELNEVLGLDPIIATGAKVTEEVIAAKVLEACDLLEETDEITDETQAVIDELNEAAEAAEDTDVNDEPEAEETAEEVDDVEQTTEELVAEADFKALQAIAAEYPEFAKGKPMLLKFKAKDVEVLRETMLGFLAKTTAPAPNAEEKVKPVEKVAGKEEKAVKGKEGVVKSVSTTSKKTRVDCICEVIKTTNPANIDKLVEQADALYVASGGTASAKETKFTARYVLSTLKNFNIEAKCQ